MEVSRNLLHVKIQTNSWQVRKPVWQNWKEPSTFSTKETRPETPGDVEEGKNSSPSFSGGEKGRAGELATVLAQFRPVPCRQSQARSEM